eukprot:CCRYP_016934-RA/>CCRYP_016934-RA protein AED:0.02 eAED:0.02 QI:195/1/1/1/1/1/5/1392/1381
MIDPLQLTAGLHANNPITDDDMFDSDDASAASAHGDADTTNEEESPLSAALDDLESRVVSALNEFKSHPGRASHGQSIHEELQSVLRPVVEVSAHIGPASARAVHASYPDVYGLEFCVDAVYTRINSELILPVLLESAQSEMIPAKRAASLRMFHVLYGEWSAPGSYLDGGAVTSSLGPYGTDQSPLVGLTEHERNRRIGMRSLRRSELLRRWVQASIPNLSPGTFTSSTLDLVAAGRGVLSASAALKPCLRYIAERIGEADDAGALRLFLPVMRMIEGVLGRLFLEGEGSDGGSEQENDALKSSCIKFLEIVVLCFSNKALPGMAGGGQVASRMKRDASQANDFSLEDLPPGHPIITRESLEEIGEYAFSTLRGLVVLGGQAKIDTNLLLDAAASASSTKDFMGGGTSPFQKILAIIKPAALTFQKIESDGEKASEDKDSFVLDRSLIKLDFYLSQKSYSLSINAIQMLATKRPLFFKEASTCLARRTMDPPGGLSGDAEGLLSKAAITGIRTHLRSSCLTLLRHIFSVTSGCWEILVKALNLSGMDAQAERALQASRQQLDLMKGGRAARTRAAIFYEWDQSTDLSRAEKRQRDTDDAEARVRAAKIARGLGAGVQLPKSMSDSCELVLLNLKHLPTKRPPIASSAQRKRPVTLDALVDAVMTNGASLSVDENHWYDRDGGDAWTIEEGELDNDGRQQLMYQCKKIETETFIKQSKVAASKAFSRVLLSTSSNRSEAATSLGSQLAARLAWMLQGVEPSSDIKDAHATALMSIGNGPMGSDVSVQFAKENPLVSSCIAHDMIPPQQKGELGSLSAASETSGLSTRVLNEAFVCSLSEEVEDLSRKKQYAQCLDLYVASVVNACANANAVPSDYEKKRIANSASSSLPHQLLISPSVTPSSLNLVGSLCDIEEVSKKAVKTSKQSIAESAAAHAAKTAAEKRATTALLVLRDVAFQRDRMRGSAIGCAVAIAAGRLPASLPIQDKALKLVMNVIFQKNSDCAGKVIESATRELELATQISIENHEKIVKANEVTSTKREKQGSSSKIQSIPQSEEERTVLESVKKPVVLFMALCVRRPEIIKVIMEMSCRDGADVMAKAVKANMPKLAKAASVKHGAASIALKVADMSSDRETPLLLSFLDNLAPATEKALPSQDLINACHEIQRNRSLGETKDSRYIIPVVSGMKRVELQDALPDFVRDSDETFKASLRRMSERLSRYAMIFRDEPDPNEPTLRGMSSCEQIVNLHRLDFNAVGLPQKRYLDAIRLCLEDDEVFNDRVIQAALDYISGKFLEGETLPLAYMRTIILTCSKHESLHSWICHVLLPRLVEGKVYSDKRQWEGWMRCAKMLENTGDQGVSSMEAIARLPPDQLKIYRTKYPR